VPASLTGGTGEMRQELVKYGRTVGRRQSLRPLDPTVTDDLRQDDPE